MAYVQDVGSMIPVDFETLPEFLDSAAHGDAHARDVRNFRVLKAEGPTTTLSFERLHAGSWTASGDRLTEFRPFCLRIEEVQGL